MSHSKTLKRGIALATAAWMGLGAMGSAWATDVQYPTWLDSVKFGGDVRLRHDRVFNTSGATDSNDRDRDRFRLRYGMAAKSGDITATFRLATSAGTNLSAPNANTVGDPLSANQTEDTSFSRKPLWVDAAYLSYKPLDQLTLMGGKMDNPFWTGWLSSLVFDPDLNPEGYTEKLDLPLGMFATLGQYSINEASAFRDADPWMFVERVGVNGGLMEGLRGMFQVTDYGFSHETTVPFSGDNKQGNTRKTFNGFTNVLSSAFNILQLDGKLTTAISETPLTFEGGYVRNTQENQNKGRDGQILGVTVGAASKAHTWEVAYYYKRLGANAVISDFVDDDFGYAGTNQGGHIMWVGYAPRENVLLKAMFYNTHILDKTLTTAAPYNSHLMLDVVVKI